MTGVERTHPTHNDVFEIWRAAESEVRGAALVCRLLVALLAGAAREEEPALQGVAPRCRLVDEIPCEYLEIYGIVSTKTNTQRNRE